MGKARKDVNVSPHTRAGRAVGGYTQNREVNDGSAALSREQNKKKSRGVRGAVRRLTAPEPPEEKYRREYREKYDAYDKLSDTQIWRKIKEAQKDELQDVERDALHWAWEKRRREERFQSPVPSIPVWMAVQETTAYLPVDKNASVSSDQERFVYEETLKNFSDEDLGIADYSPPLLDGETKDSAAWQVRRELGVNALRRWAVKDVLGAYARGEEVRTPLSGGYAEAYMKANTPAQAALREVEKSKYFFEPEPERPKLQAAIPPPPRPPDDNSNENLKEFYHKALRDIKENRGRNPFRDNPPDNINTGEYFKDYSR